MVSCLLDDPFAEVRLEGLDPHLLQVPVEFDLLKASSQLMISDELRLKLELAKNKDEESSKEKRIDFLESKLRNVEILLLELKSRD